MAKLVPFIGRKEELQLINDLISQVYTRRMLCIEAEGGVGKTRLLQEVQRREMGEKDRSFPLIITEIIDFDDHKLHISLYLLQKIAEISDWDRFGPFFQSVKDFRDIQKSVSNSASLRKKALKECEEKFIECFRKIRSRVVLFFDTTDAVEDNSDIWSYISRIFSLLENIVIIVAGRTAKTVGNILKKELENDVTIRNLPFLTREDSEAYLNQKQHLESISLESGLTKNLIFLANGRPILLDLAVEWRAREIPLDWMLKESLENLKALSEDEKKQRLLEFERRLVHHITQTRNQVDWLILLMSIIYPLDKEMISELFKIETDEAQDLFEEAKKYVFIKELPDKRIKLHDEMRRMVDKYVWPIVDADGERRRDYLKNEIDSLSRRIEELKPEEKSARKEKNIQEEMDAASKREALEQDRWKLKKRLLDSIPYMDTDEKIRIIMDLFDESTRIYRSFYRESLIPQIESCISQISPDQKEYINKLRKRLIEYFQDNGQYTQAAVLVKKILDEGGISPKDKIEMLILSGDLEIRMGNFEQRIKKYKRATILLIEILDEEDISPKDKIEMLILSGNLEIRMGNLEQGIKRFEIAVQMSKENNYPDKLVHALNGQGWAYRNKGDFDNALKSYLEAYQISTRIKDNQQTALLLNNMGFINARKGKFQPAVSNCKKALDIWKELGYRREIGTVYSTMGEIYMRFSQLDIAINFYNKALDIFEKENDVEWISIVRCGKGATLSLLREYDDAEANLNNALKYAPENLKTRIYYYQGKVHWGKAEMDEAREKFMDCRKLSQKIGELYFDYVSFSSLAEIAWNFREFDRWKEFMAEHKKKYEERKSEMDLRLRGGCLRNIADLAICHGDYDAALPVYKEAFLLIAKNQVLWHYSLNRQIEKTFQRIHDHISESFLSKLGKDLIQYWNDTPILTENSPESLITFQEWI